MSCWRPAVDLCVFYSKIRQTGSAFRDKQMLEKEKKKKQLPSRWRARRGTTKQSNEVIVLWNLSTVLMASRRLVTDPTILYIRLARVDREPNNQKAEVFDCIAEGQCHK